MAVRGHARDAVELGEPGADARARERLGRAQEAGPRGYGRVTEVLSHTIELDDQPVFFLRAGDDDVPVLYLHGVPTGADDWLPFLREGGGIAVDLPGFGRTGKRGDGDFTADGWARWLPRFLDAVGVDRVRICAHDWGAAGLLWAAREPGRVERVAVLNGAPLVGGLSLPRHARLLALPGVGEVAVGLALPSVMRRMLRKGIAEGAEPDHGVVRRHRGALRPGDAARGAAPVPRGHARGARAGRARVCASSTSPRSWSTASAIRGIRPAPDRPTRRCCRSPSSSSSRRRGTGRGSRIRMSSRASSGSCAPEPWTPGNNICRMLVRQRQAAGRILPHGPVDLLRQIALFAAAYYVYRLTRGIADNPGAATTAFNHARDLIAIERTLNVFIEPSVQTFASGERWLADITSWMYINAQTSITLGALAWIYLRRNPSFYFVRNMFLVAFGIALIGYTRVPDRPAALPPRVGLHRHRRAVHRCATGQRHGRRLFNPYAAVPSMHAGFAIMIGWPLARLVKPKVLKVFWASYPLIVTFVIVATANHFLADAFLGACTAGLGALAAVWLARVRPAAWSFRAGAKQTAPA